jgi:peptide chain release factor subunit 1
LDWLVENYEKFGTKLEIVTDKTQEGAQFCNGFGGIGGILRYSLEGGHIDDNLDDNNDYYNYDDY